MSSDRQFFIIGPLRTGSSLLARCLDDHPDCICLCESEINRALFKFYYTRLHANRMEAHGFKAAEVLCLLDAKKPDSIGSLFQWYQEVRPQIASRLEKPETQILGDKSPDFFESPDIVRHLAADYPLIYTVRDPRAIFWSIASQKDATRRLKDIRWDCLLRNYEIWKYFLQRPNVLVVRFEDLLISPESVMKTVHEHLDLPVSDRYLQPFPRLFPRRFLWTTAIDWSTGIQKDFDVSRIYEWNSRLSPQQLDFVLGSRGIPEFMDQFGYVAAAATNTPKTIT